MFTISRKCSTQGRSTAIEFQIAFDPVLHLEHLDFPESISDLPSVHHSYGIALVQNHALSCNCDGAIDPG